MGMSIDEAEALEILKDIRLTANYLQNRESRTGMACKLAIDTMRKYQKIQEVMDSRLDDDAKTNSKALGEIEVIMYGN